MYAQIDRTKEGKALAANDSIHKKKSASLPAFKFADNRNKDFVPIQKKVSITMMSEDGAQSEGIASDPADAKRKLSDFAKIKAMFDQIPEDGNPRYQCAEPHAFANIVSNNPELVTTDWLKTLKFPALAYNDAKKEDKPSEDIGRMLPCDTCKNWVERGPEQDIPIRGSVIPDNYDAKVDEPGIKEKVRKDEELRIGLERMRERAIRDKLASEAKAREDSKAEHVARQSEKGKKEILRSVLESYLNGIEESDETEITQLYKEHDRLFPGFKKKKSNPYKDVTEDMRTWLKSIKK